MPELGIGVEPALDQVASLVARYSLDLSHPAAAAHLQPPTLSVAVAADLLASVTNESMDTFDSGPAGIATERWVVRSLCELAGMGPTSDGVMTPGGTLSNFTALLLARNHAASCRGVDVNEAGVGALGRARVICSGNAHFSVQRACAALGLGEKAVHALAPDARRRLDPEAVERALRRLDSTTVPIAVVATAGTTDFGSIDPLDELADVAQRFGCWLHVDAAYGFGALFSDRLRPKLAGIARADSVTLDLHKLGWQPAATSVLLVADGQSFSALDRSVPYLNPADDCAAGYEGLLGRSIQTTRRADALKVAATFLGLGRRGLGELVERCNGLASYAQVRLQSRSDFEVVATAELTTVVFRYRGTPGRRDSVDLDALNQGLRRDLLQRGQVLLGRTSVTESDGKPRTCLKFTFVNPATSPSDVDDLIEAIAHAGARRIAGAGGLR